MSVCYLARHWFCFFCFLIINIISLFRLAHDITPCEELPRFEGILSNAESSLTKLLETSSSEEQVSVEVTCNLVSGGSRNLWKSNSLEHWTAKQCTQVQVHFNPIPEKKLERKRRKLPEIPKIQRSMFVWKYLQQLILFSTRRFSIF